MKSPDELACRTCGATAGSPCTTKPKAAAQWVKVLTWFHSTRWRDFNTARNEQAILNGWNEQYGKPGSTHGVL